MISLARNAERFHPDATVEVVWEDECALRQLLKHQLRTLQELAVEYGLTINVLLIKSHANCADLLNGWMQSGRKRNS